LTVDALPGASLRRRGRVGSRLAHIVDKRLRARKLGVWLGRTRNFRVPDSIIIGGERRKIHAPDERGTRLVFLEVLVEDCYRLRDVQRPIRTVLDVGAHVGVFCLAARNVFPDATIHAYEPNPALEHYLRQQAATARCQYFMEAIGHDDGRVALQSGDALLLTRTTPDENGEVPRIAFSKAIERLGGSVDLAKVDCEGAEWDFLKDREAWSRVRNLAMEYHLWRAHSHDEIRDSLMDLGFMVKDQDRYEDSGLIFASRSKG
jgi:FkbM family methyltransferase